MGVNGAWLLRCFSWHSAPKNPRLDAIVRVHPWAVFQKAKQRQIGKKLAKSDEYTWWRCFVA